VQPLQLNFVQLSLVEALCFDVFTEPLLELFVVFEKLGHNKVKQGPQFCHAVLDWGTREEETVSGLKLQENFPATGCVILDSLSLVENHVVPLNLHELGLIFLVVDD
jgi:hypothetical protein